MWVLFAFLIYMLAITFERSYYYMISAFPFIKLQQYLEQIELKKMDLSKFLQWNDQFQFYHKIRLMNNQAYRLACLYIHTKDLPRELQESLIKREGEQLIEELQERINNLGNISTITPLLGLLGTIMGMIKTFQIVQVSSGTANIVELSGGIWVAMLTTALGLIIAIPSQMIYNFFLYLMRKRILEMNAMIQMLQEYMMRKSSPANTSTLVVNDVSSS